MVISAGQKLTAAALNNSEADAQVWANGTSDITLTGTPTYNQIISVVIPDPGWTYKIRASACVEVVYSSSWTPWGPPYSTIRVGVDSLSDFSLAQIYTEPPISTAASNYYGKVPATDSVLMSGSHTVYLSLAGAGGGGAAHCRYSSFQGNASRTLTGIWLNVSAIQM